MFVSVVEKFLATIALQFASSAFFINTFVAVPSITIAKGFIPKFLKVLPKLFAETLFISSRFSFKRIALPFSFFFESSLNFFLSSLVNLFVFWVILSEYELF